MERKKISFEKKNHTQKTEKPSSSEGRPLFLVEYSASRAKEAKEAKKPIVLRGGGCSTMDGPIGPRAFRINAAAAARTIAEKLLSCTLMYAYARSGGFEIWQSKSAGFFLHAVPRSCFAQRVAGRAFEASWALFQSSSSSTSGRLFHWEYQYLVRPCIWTNHWAYSSLLLLVSSYWVSLFGVAIDEPLDLFLRFLDILLLLLLPALPVPSKSNAKSST